ncbi:hypothetical protein R2083_08995 [Nitrosomonas sp. Is35]|nr:hypothetical protein [Nitrosomonas sp. Is35]MDV6347651.1 hypothetical protein [Nitrosomonas sp. Is35]
MKTPNHLPASKSNAGGLFIIFQLAITDHYDDRDDWVINYLGVIYEID